MTKYVVVVVILLVAGCGSTIQDDEFNRYVQRCHDLGGIVSAADVTWSTASSKCIGNGPGELLPRFVSG